MQRVLVHVAMVLLGMTVTVLFYEGRALVLTTAEALSAGSAMSEGNARRNARDARLAGRLEAGAEDTDVAFEDPQSAGHTTPNDALDLRVRPRAGALVAGDPNDPRRHRGRAGRRGRGRAGLVAGPGLPSVGDDVRSKLDGLETRPLAVPAEAPLEDTAAEDLPAAP